MTAKKVFEGIAELNLLITGIILVILFCLLANTEASVIKFILSGVGLFINIIKKKTISKDDKDSQNSANWLITGFSFALMYYTFGLFC